MPPIAAATGSAAERRFARCPTVNSRLISSPTTRKKIVKQPVVDPVPERHRERRSHRSDSPALRSQNSSKPAPSERVGEQRPRATVASSSRTPADGAQLAKSSAAERTRWPSEPSIASASEALVPGAVVAAAVDEEGRRERTPLARALCIVGVDPLARARCCAPRSVGAAGRACPRRPREVVLGRAARSASSASTCASQNDRPRRRMSRPARRRGARGRCRSAAGGGRRSAAGRRSGRAPAAMCSLAARQCGQS